MRQDGKFRWFLVTLFLGLMLGTNVPAHAVVQWIVAPSLILANDVNGDGVANFGDSVRVTVVATSTLGAFIINPQVDLTNLGLGGWRSLTRQGTSDIWQDTYVLNNWRTAAGTPNNQLVQLPVEAWDANGLSTNNTNSTLADVCNVRGTGATASPNPCRAGQTLTIQITDNNYQATPNGGTTAQVDLSPIGLSATTAMTYIGGNIFSIGVTVPAGRNYNGPFNITLKDPFVSHPAQVYATNNVVVDTAPPTPSVSAVVMSGNSPAHPGDIVRITVTVPAYDNDVVVASAAGLASGVTPMSTPPIITDTALPITGSNGVGNAASWTMDLTLLQGGCRNNSLPITVRVTDAAGNVVVTTVYINVDLDPPNYTGPTATVYQPGSSVPGHPNYASTSCAIEIRAFITSNVVPDNLTVSVDMSSIGGAGALALSESPIGSNLYIATYVINTGTSEDTLGRNFTITARDTGNNVVYRSTTPTIGVDNVPPTISNVTMTKNGAGPVVLVGDSFTISCTATNIELGSVTVDLSALGSTTWRTLQLTNIGGNQYQGIFTLPAASTTGVLSIDGPRSFTVSANDTLSNGLLYGHQVTAATPNLTFDNEPPQLLVATYSCFDVSPPGHPRPRIGDTINLLVQLASGTATVHDGESVTVNLTDVGGVNGFPLTYDGIATYTYSFVLNPGIKNRGATFSVSIRDADGNYGPVGIIQVPLDNVPPTAGALTVTKPKSTISIGDIVTWTLGSTIVNAFDPATATFNLSMVGSSSAAPVSTHDALGNYTISWQCATYTAQSTAYQFSAILYDDSGNSTTVYSAAHPVDCRPPSIDQSGTTITPDGPQIGYANIGDRLQMWARISQFDDWFTATARLSTGTAIVEEQTMAYNSGTGRWEAFFNIRADTSWGWALEGPASYTITAVDQANNLAVATGSTWTIDNTTPVVSSFTLFMVGAASAIAPEVEFLNLLNVGSYSSFDRLIASGTLVGSVSTSIPATLNLTPIGGGGAVSLTNITGTNCRFSDPLNPTTWGWVRDIGTYTLFATFYEPSGNPVVTSADLCLDTKRPQITAAAFDGNTLSMTLSEDCGIDVLDQINLNGANALRIHGIAGGLATFTTITTPPNATGPFSLGGSVDIVLATSTLRTMVNWDSTSPLRISIATGVIHDLASNTQLGISQANPLNVTIADNIWRTRPQITAVTGNSNWPASVTVTLDFNKPIDTTTLRLYRACIVTNAGRTAGGTFDYRYRYHFNPAWDNVTFANGDRRVIIDLGPDGKDWVARKIGSGTTQIAIAVDGVGVPDVFVQDKFGLTVVPVTYAAPVVGTINPSPTGFRIVPSPIPVLDLINSRLNLSFYDRGLLSTSDYGTTPIDPVTVIATMSLPVADQGHAVTTFNNKIILHTSATGGGMQAIVTGGICDVASNTSVSSNTVSISLNAADMQNILNLRTKTLYLEVLTGAFHDNWGYPSERFLTTGPGGLTVIAPAPGTASGPMITAYVLNNATSPLRAPALNTLYYEVEINPGTYTSRGNALVIPIDQSILPTMRFDTPTPGAATVEFPPPAFDSWTSRTLSSGQVITIARFRNVGPWTATFQRTPAAFTASGVTDVFGTTTWSASNTIYSHAQRSLSFAGFIPPPQIIELDNQSPRVSSLTPSFVAMGAVPAGSATFRVYYDELMDPATIPTLTLTRGAETISFTFSNWNNPQAASYAVFANVQPITSATTNGTWSYHCDGGKDLAGNPQVPSVGVNQVFIQTQGPALTEPPLFTSVQNFIDATTVLTNATYSPYAGMPTISAVPASITCTYVFPAVGTPHRVQFYNLGVLVGAAQLSTTNGQQVGTATIDQSTFLVSWTTRANTGPQPLDVRIADSLGNLTNVVTRVTYDSAAPAVSQFWLTSVGSFSNGIGWFNPDRSGNAVASVTLGAGDTPLRLVMRDTLGATTTLDLTANPSWNYTGSFGAAFTTEGDYWLAVADAAGNPGIGAAASRTLRVDRTSPIVGVATCVVPLTGIVGVTPPGSATFQVSFVDAGWNQMHRGYAPTLRLIRAGYPNIECTPGVWVNATTASFTNTTNIIDESWTGPWQYEVSGAVDLALNPTGAVTTGTVELRTRIPRFSDIAIITNPLTLGFGTRTNQPFSDGVSTPFSIPGIATITFNYSAGPFNLPHTVELWENDITRVATATIVPTGPTGGEASIIPTAMGWFTASGSNNLRHTVRVVDATGNIGVAPRELWLDNLRPTMVDLVFPGLNVGAPDLVYYSPTISPWAIASVTFVLPDTCLGVVATSTGLATFTLAVNPNASATQRINSFRMTDLVAGIPEGSYLFTIADAAGNLAGSAMVSGPTRTLVIDNTPPTEIAIIAEPPDNPNSIGTGPHTFRVTFSEAMDQANATPSLRLATGTPATVITTNFAGWAVGGTQALFTLSRDINQFDIQGSWTYQLTGGQDLARNPFAASGINRSVTVFSRGPIYSARLFTQQGTATDTGVVPPFQQLVNQSFSPVVLPGVATLSISYLQGPYGPPHRVLIYDPTNNLVGSTGVIVDTIARTGIASIGATTFNPVVPPNTARNYTLQIVDSNGNVGLSVAFVMAYDTLPANVTGFTFAGMTQAPASTTYYYSPTARGPRNLTFTTALGVTEPLRLAMNNTLATHTWTPAATPDVSRNYTWSVTGNDPTGAPLIDGQYIVTTLDNAGNISTGAPAQQAVVIDRVPPTVTVDGPNTLHLTNPGNATFAVRVTTIDPFGVNANAANPPTLVLATGTNRVRFAVSGWYPGATLTDATASFTNLDPITASMPQGVWQLTASGTDLAGNASWTTQNIVVDSRGPTLTAIRVLTWQGTTASAPPPADILTDTPFSPTVAPGQAAVNITWPASPAMPLSINVRQAGITVASASLAGLADAASATWIYTGTLLDGTYDLVVVNGFGDQSLVQGRLVQDAVAPRIVTVSVPNDGHTANGVYCFNPNRAATVAFSGTVTPEAGPLFMRSTGINATDTFPLTLDGSTGAISATFAGRHDTTNTLLIDGLYRLDVVDAAGNVGVAAAPGASTSANAWVDTQAPAVTGYTTLIGGLAVTRFNPNVGVMTIVASTTERPVATGAYQLLVQTGPLSQTVRVLPMSIRTAGVSVQATWDGRPTSSTNFVTNGTYKFIVTDLAGNVAATSTSIVVNAQPFTLSSVTQVTATQLRLNFNQDVNTDPINLSGMGLTIVDDLGGAAPPVLTRQLTSANQAIDLTFATPLTDGRRYTITIQPGTLRSADLAAIAAPNNTGSVLIDAHCATITGVNFTGLTGQRDFNVVFDKTVTIPSVETLGNWTLTEGARTITLSGAVLQGDGTTVRLTASEDLTDARTYVIRATNVLDTFLNPCNTSYSFAGRDLTAPVFSITAFSNPANEYNVSIVVQANEPLSAAPTARVSLSGSVVGEVTLVAGNQPRLYHGGVYLDPNNPGNVQIEVRGSDIAGNAGVNTSSFNTATVSPNRRAVIASVDGSMRATFEAGTVNAVTLAKVFTHALATGTTVTGNRRALRVAGVPVEVQSGALRAAQAPAELTPVGVGYELAMPSAKVARPFIVDVAIPGGRDQDGLALFALANDGNWTFATKATASGAYRVSTNQPTHFAVLKDAAPPAITVATVLDATRPLSSEQPEITGTVSDGTGVVATSVVAILDGAELPMTHVSGNGPQVAFRFVPGFPLVSGEHTFAVRARDVTGNETVSPTQTFAVQAPLKIMEVQTFPNPARRFAKIRVAVNRRDLNSDLVNVKIYDVSGAQVCTLADLNPVLERTATSQRYVYDIPWDLTNGDGEAVANGVYLLRIKLSDPLDPEKSTKVTHKVAVLR